MSTTADRIASNATLAAVSRIAMIALPVVITWGVYAVTAYVDMRFTAQAESLAVVRVEVKEAVATINEHETRLGVIDDILTKGRADRIAQYQELATRLTKIEDTTNAKLDKLNDSVVQLGNAVTGLTVQVQRLTPERNSR